MAHKYKLPELEYGLGDLEPVISKEIMDLHYNKHHQAYINNLNAALEKYEEAEKNNDVAKMISLQSAIKFNGGGFINHSYFWKNLAPQNAGGGKPPEGELADAIKKEFGSLDQFIEKFNAATGPLQGSGWGWLGYCKDTKRIMIETTHNQDPLAIKGLVPLLGVDVWEHAYYLQYKNARPEYLKAIWKVINWKNVAERYSKVKG